VRRALIATRDAKWAGGGQCNEPEVKAYYEERYRERAVRQLTQRANKLGMRLVADPQVA
jgi:hypothetical protein